MRYLKIISLLLFIYSCSSKKNILLIQDSAMLTAQDVTFVEHKAKVDDVYKIDIYTDIPESISGFETKNTAVVNNRESMILNGFQVNSNGYIFLPVIGDVYILGSTINEIRTKIYDLYVVKGLLVNPVIDVKLLNAHFTILGEVNLPGKYDFIQNNMDILQAIGSAGGLTINGLRNNIKIIRDKEGKKTVDEVDLTSSNVLSAKSFQIFSGDIIIVSPNSSRIKNAGIIGNSGTLISLLAFILSSIIVINGA